MNGSRALKGSSINKTSGLAASALAKPTRCCIPPDNSWANFEPQAPSSTISKIAAACRIRSFLLIFLISSGIATLSKTDLCGMSAKFWKTIPIFWFLNFCKSCVPKPITSVPSINICPSVGSNNRLKCLTNVDFPLPERPMIQNISPLFTDKLTSATPTTALYLFKTSALLSPSSRIARNASSGR
ncbi:hypothetical protein OM2255_04240 [Rhodobacterales bacterium HTCC2255]|nr:hypothetical protein OM2255_04240 [Rhodobacterales bacterium HTCC2255]